MTNSKKAYNDLKASPGWKANISIAALVNLIPILSWNNYGYFINWAKNLPAQKAGCIDATSAAADAPMPAYRIDGKNFTMGFFVFLIGLVTGVVVGILSAIPFIGVLLGIVGFVVGGAFSNAMAIRCATTGSLGDAFQLRDVWNAFRQNPSGIFDATYLSLLIVLLIGIGVSIIYGVLLGVVIGLSAMSTTGIDPVALLSAAGPLGALLTVVYVYVMSWLMVLIMAITFRAVGHWACA